MLTLNIDPPLKRCFLINDLKIIPDFLINVSPERRKDIEDQFQRGLIISIIYSPKSIAKAYTETRSITISIALIERLWGFCISSFSFYYKYFAGRDLQEAFLFDFTDPDTARLQSIVQLCGKLTDWEICDCCFLRNEYKHFSEQEDFKGIIEFFRIALAYILLHELSHIILNHTYDEDASSNIQQENEADKFAYDHILSPLEDEDASNTMKMKRGIGIASANLFLVFLMLKPYSMGKQSLVVSDKHPPVHERLNWAIGNHFGAECYHNDDLWGFIVSMLALYTSKYKLPRPIENAVSFYSAAQAYFEMFSQEEGYHPYSLRD